jgi:Rrf2 family transcriptional regulator, nitric oxide-sensitive transcriptional repressor
MNFNKTTSYALSILNYMAEHKEEKFSAKTLHEILDIPWQYLRQLLTSLSKDGFISSTQGRGGGFRLSKNPEEITLADIVDAVEGLNIMNTCIMGFENCPFDHKCAMHETWEETRDGIMGILKNTTLASLSK